MTYPYLSHRDPKVNGMLHTLYQNQTLYTGKPILRIGTGGDFDTFKNALAYLGPQRRILKDQTLTFELTANLTEDVHLEGFSGDVIVDGKSYVWQGNLTLSDMPVTLRHIILHGGTITLCRSSFDLTDVTVDGENQVDNGMVIKSGQGCFQNVTVSYAADAGLLTGGTCLLGGGLHVSHCPYGIKYSAASLYLGIPTFDTISVQQEVGGLRIF